MEAITVKSGKQNKTGPAANQVTRKNQEQPGIFEFVDNRKSTARLASLQRMIYDSPRHRSPDKAGPASAGVVQGAWKLREVNLFLKKDERGKAAVIHLNAQKYTVIHFDKMTITRTYYTDETLTESIGEPEVRIRNGFHNYEKKIIGISDQLDSGRAASTLVHEVTHAKQHKENDEAGEGEKPYPDTISKEIDAHIKQEEFAIAAGIPPKVPEFRTPDNEVNREEIEKWVRENYETLSKHVKVTKSEYNVIEKIRPWPLGS